MTSSISKSSQVVRAPTPFLVCLRTYLGTEISKSLTSLLHIQSSLLMPPGLSLVLLCWWSGTYQPRFRNSEWYLPLLSHSHICFSHHCDFWLNTKFLNVLSHKRVWVKSWVYNQSLREMPVSSLPLWTIKIGVVSRNKSLEENPTRCTVATVSLSQPHAVWKWTAFENLVNCVGISQRAATLSITGASLCYLD